VVGRKERRGEERRGEKREDATIHVIRRRKEMIV
jgi:hypothetical protein